VQCKITLCLKCAESVVTAFIKSAVDVAAEIIEGKR